MSWSEIKKAVNSDLSTPLNEQIANIPNEIGFKKYASAEYSYPGSDKRTIIDNIQKNGLLLLYPRGNTYIVLNDVNLTGSVANNTMFIVAFAPTDKIEIKGQGSYTATGFYSILTEK